MRAAVLALATACAGSSSPPPTPTGPPASLAATTPAPGDVQVATVNGRAVWGSCVTAQTSRGVTRDVALRECVDFELMAQEAEARGIATDPEIVLATRTALVSQLVARDYEAKYTKPSDFGPFWEQIVTRNRLQLDHPEYRGSAYVRIDVPKGASAAEDAKAKQLAEEISAALANERGLSPNHLLEIAERVVAGRAKIKHEVVVPYHRWGRIDEGYASTLFSIEEVGRTSKPGRTEWGWDVLLLTSVIPEERPTPQVIAQNLPDIQRTYFSQWANQIAQRLGLRIKLFDENIPLLEQM